MRLVFMGPPGAGKGTQAVLVARSLGIPHVSTGDILRAEVAADTELGQKAARFMSSGELVPDDLMVAMIRSRVARSDCEGGFILDGFPRTVPQAEALDEALGERRIEKAIHFEVPDEAVLTRLGARGRADDDEKTILNRLRVYREQTAPVIEHYRRAGILEVVEANRDIEAVARSVVELLGSGEGAR